MMFAKNYTETPPFFSVVVTTHNAQSTIIKTLESVVQQDFKDFELIVVDDASTDDTVKVTRSILTHSNINQKIVVLKQNEGVSFARNFGVTLSKGDFVAFLDDDDVWLPSKLSIQHEVLVNEKSDWVFSNYYIIDESYDVIGKRHRAPGYYSYSNFLLRGNPVGMLTVCIRRSLLIKYHFEKIKHEDYDLWLHLAKNNVEGILIDDYLASYMKHKGSISSNKIKSLIWTYQVFRRYEKSRLRCVILMFGYLVNVVIRKISSQ